MTHPGGTIAIPLRERRRAETTGHIVDVARQLFADGGYAGTRTSDIARAAGVSDATLFRYFDAKATIALHGVSERIDLALELLAAQPPELGPLDATRAAFDEMLRRELFRTDDPVVAEVALVIDNPELWPELDGRINGASERLAAVLARRAGHEAPTLADRVTAHAIVGAIQAAAAAWFEEPAGPTPPDLVTRALNDLADLR